MQQQMRAFLWGTIAFITAYCAYFSLAVVRPREAPLPAQLIARRRRRMATAIASPSAPSPPPPTAAARLLTQADVLRRVPEGGVAFFTLANAAYGDLAINWALLLLPVLARVGCAEHAFVGALDGTISAALLARGLPVMRVGLNGSTEVPDDASGGGGGDDGGGNFRLVFSKFRAYGVTKAVLIAWLLRANRHVVVSDVDCAWLSPPHHLLAELPEADVMAGTDCLQPRVSEAATEAAAETAVETLAEAAAECLCACSCVCVCQRPPRALTARPHCAPSLRARHVLEDDDRSERGTVEARCGHHPGSRSAAWFNTGVLLFRAHTLALAPRPSPSTTHDPRPTP